jgi:hypothetical protein
MSERLPPFARSALPADYGAPLSGLKVERVKLPHVIQLLQVIPYHGRRAILNVRFSIPSTTFH